MQTQWKTSKYIYISAQETDQRWVTATEQTREVDACLMPQWADAAV